MKLSVCTGWFEFVIFSYWVLLCFLNKELLHFVVTLAVASWMFG